MSDLIPSHVDGYKALSVVPDLTENLPPEIREGIARRRLVATGHPCPCGAAPVRLNRAQRRRIAAQRRHGNTDVIRVPVIHEDDCPAADDVLNALANRHGITLRRWM
ncbi:hypothetical protein PWG71_28500 [Nocardiopsis sp. N85]|uniref:hypothetical protein n=1 Tax=Nocardiopsis sp. N85 TaxID=3029400 RepID=UPI00237EFEAF|nr:hypothetical protein [Nocardiopsis sp. N85]MDE3725338.1 hypothetical protein [Nocardiopsis sp. N85]